MLRFPLFLEKLSSFHGRDAFSTRVCSSAPKIPPGWQSPSHSLKGSQARPQRRQVAGVTATYFLIHPHSQRDSSIPHSCHSVDCHVGCSLAGQGSRVILENFLSLNRESEKLHTHGAD